MIDGRRGCTRNLTGCRAKRVVSQSPSFAPANLITAVDQLCWSLLYVTYTPTGLLRRRADANHARHFKIVCMSLRLRLGEDVHRGAMRRSLVVGPFPCLLRCGADKTGVHTVSVECVFANVAFLSYCHAKAETSGVPCHHRLRMLQNTPGRLSWTQDFTCRRAL
ncbi:hypothetical protein BDW22DRAFT_92800 [Trametopsis cervina]|nr:hypothetical protein BDW22DRAFT_92800 [Trametopsis cervina]